LKNLKKQELVAGAGSVDVSMCKGVRQERPAGAGSSGLGQLLQRLADAVGYADLLVQSLHRA
jgi:hypothetical protein